MIKNARYILICIIFLFCLFPIFPFAQEADTNNTTANLLYSSNPSEDVNGEVLSYPRNQLNQMTVVLWVKTSTGYQAQDLFSETLHYTVKEQEYENKSRFFGIDHANNWVFKNQKKQKTIKDEVILFDQWNFITLVFDNINNQNRIIINDTIHNYTYLLRNLTNQEGVESRITIDGSNASVQDVKIYNTILSLEEIEALKGSSIPNNREKYPIIEKADYVKNNSQIFSNIVLNSKYKVISDYLYVEHTLDSYKEYTAKLKQKDTFSIQSVDFNKQKAEILTEDGITGYIDRTDFQYNILPADSSRREAFTFFLKNLPYADNSYRTIGICFVISIAITMIITAIGMKLYYKSAKYHTPIRVFFFPGSILLTMYGIFSIASESETAWFLKEGFKLFPKGYTSLYHWLLAAGIIIAFLVWIIMIGRMIAAKKILNAFIFGILSIIGNILFSFLLQLFVSYMMQFKILGGLAGIFVFLAVLISILKGSIQYFFAAPEVQEEKNNWQDTGYTGYQWHSEDTSQGTDYQRTENAEESYSYEKNTQNQSEEDSRKKNVNDFFKGVSTKEEAKKRYRELMKIYHPDNQCGDNNITQIIQSQYEEILEKL